MEVAVDGSGYRIAPQRRGDPPDVLLDYVGYRLDDLRAAYAGRIAAAQLPATQAQELADALEAGLTGYTYLSDEPLA